MFENTTDRNKRKWLCFVCGKGYTSYEEYKEHIKMEHEEGREYLSCPDCDAPVRDMKMHYKCKHPSRIMPKGLQNKVSVWRDFSPTGKKKKTRKPQFRSGMFYSQKNGREIPYRSGMEADVYECLEADMDVLSYQAEPFKVPYFHNKEWHNYIPDIRVNFADGSTQIMEIKPSNQTHYERNKAKWTTMKEHAFNRGWDFTVITEKGLEKMRMKVRRQMID